METEDETCGIVFHSASIPQILDSDTADLIQADSMVPSQNSADIPNNDKNKHMYQMLVLYYQPSQVKHSKTNKQVRRYKLKMKRILLGKKNAESADAAISSAQNPIVIKAMRNKQKSLLITEDTFDKETALKRGGFMGKTFWTSNLIWGKHRTIDENFGEVVAGIRAKMPFMLTKNKRRTLTSANQFKKTLN